jgi:hypothetical protein
VKSNLDRKGIAFPHIRRQSRKNGATLYNKRSGASQIPYRQHFLRRTLRSPVQLILRGAANLISCHGAIYTYALFAVSPGSRESPAAMFRQPSRGLT